MKIATGVVLQPNMATGIERNRESCHLNKSTLTRERERERERDELKDKKRWAYVIKVIKKIVNNLVHVSHA